MTKVKSSILINKPIEEVFEYTASPYNGPAFIPNLNENTNIFPEAKGKGQKFDWRYNMAGIDLRGKAEVMEFDPPKRVVINSYGDTDSIWTYVFESEGSGTKVEVEIDYKFSETTLQRLANKIFIDKLTQLTANQMLDNLKVILE